MSEMEFEIHEDDKTNYEFFRHCFAQQGEQSMAVYADLKASLDALTAAVAKVSMEVKALKAMPSTPPSVDPAAMQADALRART